jgi:hypothetical protein
VSAQASIKCSDGNILVIDVDVTHIAEQKEILIEVSKVGRDLRSDMDGTIKYDAKIRMET